MMFFEDLSRHANNIAFIEGERQLNYQQLQQQVQSIAKQLPAASLVLIKASNNIASMLAYLACLQSQTPMMLVDATLSDDNLQALITSFHINVLIEDGKITVLDDSSVSVNPALALLLSTSGSTGSPKQVALSASNLDANARAIGEYLPILATDKTITTLAPHYSYGLSVINSHLLVGATIVLNNHSLMSREFWSLLESQQITSFAGVPFSYDMLLRLRFTQKDLPTLRYFTQAGGKLSEDKVRQLAEYANEKGKQFFVMYGQTEATARIAYNANPRAKPTSIGKVIPNGELWLADGQGQNIDGQHQQGELTYRGDNVMLGYASGYDELSVFTPNNTLATGDIAFKDEDGDYHICGRLKRMVKLFGVRISLDAVESLLADKCIEVAVLGDDDKLQIALGDGEDTAHVQQFICEKLQLHPSVVEVKMVLKLPRTPSNKIDYNHLQGIFNTPVQEHID